MATPLGEIVRFAPSPTGFLHVGGARTAIFNWLIAKHTGGRFLLRIEDTDRARSTQESIQQIIDSLYWLDLQWDGDVVFQSKRLDRHKELVAELVSGGTAYPCFCTKEELAARRREMEKRGETFRYDGRCLQLTEEEVREKLDRNLPHAIRLHIKDEDITFTDRIHGPMQISSSTLDDFVIRRMDGTPTYQMAVVADDHDMNITLVLRGDDHLVNTPKQILLYRALGWPIPEFAHVPLILGPDKIRLSKRHGATSIAEFRDMGIMPEALFNYLCLLGWAPGDDTEVMSREEIISRFDIARINRSAAVFDQQKLRWMNRKYLSQLPLQDVYQWVKKRLAEEGYKITEQEEGKFILLTELYQQRAYTKPELLEAVKVYFEPPQEYDAKGQRKYFNEKGLSLLKDFYEAVESNDGVFESIEKSEAFIRSFAEKKDISAAKVIHPLRLALTGKTESPGIFEMVYILGREKVMERVGEVGSKK